MPCINICISYLFVSGTRLLRTGYPIGKHVLTWNLQHPPIIPEGHPTSVTMPEVMAGPRNAGEHQVGPPPVPKIVPPTPQSDICSPLPKSSAAAADQKPSVLDLCLSRPKWCASPPVRRQSMLLKRSSRPTSRSTTVAKATSRPSSRESVASSASDFSRASTAWSECDIADISRVGYYTMVGRYMFLRLARTKEHVDGIKRAVPSQTHIAVDNAFRPVAFPVLSGTAPGGKLAYLYTDTRPKTHQRVRRNSLLAATDSRPVTRRSDAPSRRQMASALAGQSAHMSRVMENTESLTLPNAVSRLSLTSDTPVSNIADTGY